MSQKFEIKKDASQKSLFINLNGRFEKEDGLAYLNEYKRNVQGINPQEYTLKFDCTDLAVSVDESLQVLQDCIKLYSESNFKKVIAILGPKQSVLSMQLNRLIRNAHLDNFEIQK